MRYLYWALSLPVLGQEIALIARPVHRNVTLRLLEPLGPWRTTAKILGSLCAY